MEGNAPQLAGHGDRLYAGIGPGSFGEHAVTGVNTGEEIIIAKAGRPIAKLGPISHGTERKPWIAKGRVTEAFFEELPEEELQAWEQ